MSKTGNLETNIKETMARKTRKKRRSSIFQIKPVSLPVRGETNPEEISLYIVCVIISGFVNLTTKKSLVRFLILLIVQSPNIFNLLQFYNLLSQSILILLLTKVKCYDRRIKRKFSNFFIIITEIGSGYGIKQFYKREGLKVQKVNFFPLNPISGKI